MDYDALREITCCAGAGRGAPFTLPGAEAHYPPDLELEPVHIEIDLRLDLQARSARGTVTHTIEARRAGPRTITLDAVALADVRAADADGRAVHARYDGERLAVSWEEPFAAGESRRLAVSYAVTEPTAGLYFSRPDETWPDAPWFCGTDHETERARHWLPCIDLPGVRCRLDFRLRAESRFTILANGALVSETDHGDGTKTAHWRLPQPCPSYLTCFAIGDFVRRDDGEHEGAPVAYFTSREHTAEDLQRSFGRTRAMLAWMTKKLGSPYPFPKYFQFALPRFGGAMENISLVSWDDQFVLDETLAKEWSWLVDAVNVHEMAHTWFGDHIVCRDFAHAWLKESWATYMQQCWLEDTLGEDEKLYDFYTNVKAYVTEAKEKYRRPIVTRRFNSSWQMFDRHLYPGGAARLHTLRCELGDEVFWEGVRDYVARFCGKTVETDDFRRVLEERSGRSLGRFFDQWFRSPGYPALKVSFEWDAEAREGRFEIEQTQVAADSKDGGGNGDDAAPVFELGLELGWVIDGELVRRAVRLERAKHAFNFPMAKDPEQVRVDPRGRVLHELDFDPGAARLRRQLTGARDVIGRIQAAHALAKTATRENVEAVRDAYRDEKFWGVRVQMADALASAGCQAAVEALAELVGTENDPMVLEHLLRSAGRYRDALVRDALVARLQKGIPFYRAKQAAYEALGAQRDAAPLPLLKEAAAKVGFGGIEQAGALRALAATRREEAIEVLKAETAPGKCNRTRPVAVAALGELGAEQPREARARIAEHLVDLLRDPIDRVHKAARAGLGAVRATAAIPQLEAYRPRLAAQDRVDVDRTIAGLRAAEEPKVAGLRKQLEELQEKVRKLADRVEKAEARGRSVDGAE